MKLLILGFCLVAVGLAERVAYPRGCIYALGKCIQECEVGTRAFTTGCGYVTPEATCDNPRPVEDRTAQICDYSACYCEPPTVRHPHSKKCVSIEQCPKKE